jgi:hypothetical protein
MTCGAMKEIQAFACATKLPDFISMHIWRVTLSESHHLKRSGSLYVTFCKYGERNTSHGDQCATHASWTQSTTKQTNTRAWYLLRPCVGSIREAGSSAMSRSGPSHALHAKKYFSPVGTCTHKPQHNNPALPGRIQAVCCVQNMRALIHGRLGHAISPHVGVPRVRL